MVNPERALRPGDVRAKLDFVLPTSKINLRFVAPGAEANTGKQEEREVVIRDGRNERSNLTLNTAGFELVDHVSKVTDFHDKEQIEKIYGPEIKEMLKSLLGCDDVTVFMPYHRRTGAAAGGEVQPPGSGAHVDITPHFAPTVAQEHLPSPDYAYSRFAAINVWRALSKPPHDWPLAVCDGRSVPADAGVFNGVKFVDKIPDLANVQPPEETGPGGHIFKYDPRLKWYYFSNQTRDEALCFKLFDSERQEGWRVPHAAFFDPTHPDASCRESYEIRTICFWKYYSKNRLC